jgi:CheY-like chemotaxis protein
MAGESLLVVDDNPANQKLLEAILRAKGYEVRSAGTADEAIAAIEAELPKLILMDLQLPDVDGLTLTRRLRGNPAHADIVIIAVTSYAMKGDRERALVAGCDDYVTKPIDTRRLPELVATHLASTGPRA